MALALLTITTSPCALVVLYLPVMVAGALKIEQSTIPVTSEKDPHMNISEIEVNEHEVTFVSHIDDNSETSRINQELAKVSYTFDKGDQRYDVQYWGRGVATFGGTMLALYMKTRSESLTKVFSLPVKSQILFSVGADAALMFHI